jgi:hypothetical protein
MEKQTVLVVDATSTNFRWSDDSILMADHQMKKKTPFSLIAALKR